MTSTIKVPSSVVPIDVTGQPFSRMASFRRSLIHVDFFIRRKKKKDKRRNTVSEGDTKVLKNIINEGCQHALMPNLIFEGRNSKCEINHNSQLQDENTKTTDITAEEKNNNSKETCRDQEIRKYIKMNNNSEEKNKVNGLKGGNVKFDIKNHNNLEVIKPSTVNKRKLKGHIPISTISAAMSVAVEMRELNGRNQTEDQSSSGNCSDRNSSDSENKPKCQEKNGVSVYSEVIGHNSTSYNRNRVKKVSSYAKSRNAETTGDAKETEIYSGTSSDNNATNDDATSTESDVFFISSDESDGDSSDILEHNYGSSLSLSTVSNGSLNSLLSQTGTEMASSTGTLTSVGIERLPTPPPFPPIAAATTVEIMKSDCKSSSAKDSTNQMQDKLSITQIDLTKPSKKIKPSQKVSKPLKMEKVDVRKNPAEGTKNIFSTLVNIKSRTKEQNKFKTPDNKSNKMQNKSFINMYGSSSPKNLKQIPSFIKENISPVIENKPSLQSFSSHQSVQENDEQESKYCLITKPEFHGATHNYSTSIKAIDNIPFETDKIEVPFKYSHKVIVTPIQRQTINERNISLEQCKRSLFQDNDDQKHDSHNRRLNQNLSIFPNPITNNKIEVSATNQYNKPQRPMTLQTGKPKSAARVLLDPEGRVIQCTNSLDRNPHHPTAVGITRRFAYDTNLNKHAEYPINPGEILNQEKKIHEVCDGQSNSLQIHSNASHCTNKIYESNTNQAFRNGSNATLPNAVSRSNIQERLEYHPYCMHAQQSLSEVFRPHPVVENRGNVHSAYSGLRSKLKLPYPTETISLKNQLSTDNKDSKSLPSSVTRMSPDPNISGLPSSETMLTQHNVNLHSLNMEKLSMPPKGNNCANLLENTFTPPLNGEFHKPQQSTMSTEDLFAVIHNCKKRMNIKTNSDISLASSSSRSSSSSCFRPVSSKGALAETGFLSPRNLSSSFENSRDRRSWADFRPITGTPGDRKSLASDRLGPTKPTSMHDFKMLLLQTRSNNQVLGPRKSAVEMLKVPASCDKTRINSAPLSSSSRGSNSLSVQNSPLSELIIYNGHSTVPFKRNNRARSSLQSRYTMYPPIFEDCSEDSENTRDAVQNFSAKTIEEVEQVHNTQIPNNANRDMSENLIQNLRHWL